MGDLVLSASEQAMIDGRRGPVLQFCMEMIVKAGQMLGAQRLERIEAAYVNTTFTTNEPNTDFLKWSAEAGIQVVVPTYTNVSIYDIDNPMVRSDEYGQWAARKSVELIDLHSAVGCKRSLTCAPYQLPNQPGFGTHIAASESNAVSYFNSVIGARTLKYGDFIDLAAAFTGRVPYAGLHANGPRKATLVLHVDALPDALSSDDLSYQLIGHAMGRKAGSAVPILVGINPQATSDNLRSIGSTGASSGGVAMYHVAGKTPEAPTLEAAIANPDSVQSDCITMADILSAKQELTRFDAGDVTAIALGTPHASLKEVGNLVALLDGRRVQTGLPFFIQMNRFTQELARERGWIEALRKAGVTPITDTCLYWRPVADGLKGRVMTNSGKFAYYAPGELSIETTIGSVKECVESAITGKVWRDPELRIA